MDVPVVMQRQVPVIQNVQKTVEVPLVQFIDKVVDVSVIMQRFRKRSSRTMSSTNPQTCNVRCR